MAKFEGKGTGTTGASSYSLRLEVEESSYSIANNTSSVSWKLYLISTTYNFSSWSFTIKASVDGEVYNKSESRSISKNTTLLIASGSKTITHNSDGSKKISCSASVSATGASYLPGNISVSGTLNLTNIPRTSKVSLSSTNFNIGTSITINTNRASSSFTHTAVIKFNGSTVRTQKSIGASYKWDTSELYDYIPKANKATGKVTLTTYSGSTEIGSSSVSFTANVTNSNPTFSNCTYEDVGSISTQLTGNNQVLINGCNSLKTTISTANKAVAKNGATMSKYRLVCGSKSVEASYSSSADVSLTLDNVTSMTFIVYAIDSRGNSTAVTKSVETWKDYSDIKIKTGSATRDGGVGTQTTLTFEGELWNDSFGAESNGIVICQYKYKKTNESTYGTPIDIIPTISGNSFSFSSTIKGDAEAEGFNLSNSFNIQVIVTDKIKTATYDILLGSGTPAMAIHRDGVAFGAPYDEDIGGALQAFGLATLGQLEIENLKVISDCNDISLKTGFYYCDGNTLNIPSDSAWFLQVMRKVFDDGDTDVITQIAYRYRNNEIWIRQYNSVSSTSWKDWVPVNQDSGWIIATLTSSFKPYNNNNSNTPIYRKVGKTVEIKGIVSPSATISAGDTANIFVLPEGYRPLNRAVTKICQGTSRNVWLLSIGTNGAVEFARYGTTNYADASTSVWLPFQATFLID